jgi:hypothetical protein
MDHILSSLRSLAQLTCDVDQLAREGVRQGAMRVLKASGVPDPKKLVQRAIPDSAVVTEQEFETTEFLDDPEPWPEEVDGPDLLDELVQVFARHLALVDGAAEAFALWTLHAHALEASFVSPLLALNSPVKRCGKTTAMNLLASLVPRALPTSNITPAAVFRAMEEWSPTLLIDEADTFLGKSDELTGILNSGHTRASAHVVRVVGDDLRPTGPSPKEALCST